MTVIPREGFRLLRETFQRSSEYVRAYQEARAWSESWKSSLMVFGSMPACFSRASRKSRGIARRAVTPFAFRTNHRSLLSSELDSTNQPWCPRNAGEGIFRRHRRLSKSKLALCSWRRLIASSTYVGTEFDSEELCCSSDSLFWGVVWNSGDSSPSAKESSVFVSW